MSADDILSAIAPELDSVDPTRRAIILDLADKQTSDDAFKESRDHYVALLAAHMLTLSNRGGDGGVVTSKKEGDLAISYGGIANAEGLASTSYGQELLRLRRGYIFAPRFQ